MKATTSMLIILTVCIYSSTSRVTTISLDNVNKQDLKRPRNLGLMGPSDAELAERQARKDKNILDLKLMISESKKDNEIRGINAKLEELEQNAAEIQDTMYAKLGELMNLVGRIRAQRIAGSRVSVIKITNGGR
jgi:hypothetical protein